MRELVGKNNYTIIPVFHMCREDRAQHKYKMQNTKQFAYMQLDRGKKCIHVLLERKETKWVVGIQTISFKNIV